jgi:hypothetical protein
MIAPQQTKINITHPKMSAGSIIGILRNVRLIPTKKASILVAIASIRSNKNSTKSSKRRNKYHYIKLWMVGI